MQLIRFSCSKCYYLCSFTNSIKMSEISAIYSKIKCKVKSRHFLRINTFCIDLILAHRLYLACNYYLFLHLHEIQVDTILSFSWHVISAWTFDYAAPRVGPKAAVHPHDPVPGLGSLQQRQCRQTGQWEVRLSRLVQYRTTVWNDLTSGFFSVYIIKYY